MTLLGGGLMSMPGCFSLTPFQCVEAEQCVREGKLGICAEPGYCAFEDGACSSGFRYDGLAGPAFSGECVEPTEQATDDSGSSSSGLVGSSSSSTSSPADSSSSSSESADDSTGTINLCGDRPCACAVEIAAGTGHTCALRNDGSVVCWGNDDNGELGRGELGGAVAWPQRVALPRGFTTASMFIGDRHSCVISDAGEMFCWGRNAAGEVDPTLGPEALATPTEVTWVAPAATAATSINNTCAVARGETQCWGDNADGQLGDAMSVAGPAVVGADVPFVGFEELAGARRHACGRVGGEVWCWGTDYDGQLGNDLPLLASPDPVMTALSVPARTLSAGAFHTCAVVDDETRVQCWGSGGVGQLGTGDGLDSEVPLDILLTLDETVVQLVAQGDHTCLLTSGGGLHCWGANGGDIFLSGGGGALGPVEVGIADELPEPIERVALGHRHMCVITEGGHVFCWGEDDVEQLGPFDPQLGARAVELDLGCEDER